MFYVKHKIVVVVVIPASADSCCARSSFEAKIQYSEDKMLWNFNHEHSAGSAVVIVSVQSSSLTKHVGRSRNKTFRRQNVLI